MAATTFQSDFLLSPSSINNFISADTEAAAVIQDASTQGRAWNHSSGDFDEWRYLATGIFLTLASYSLHLLCMKDLSKRVWIESRHAMNDAAAIKTYKVFKDNLLARSVNTHRLDTADYFLSPPATTTLATYPTSGTLNFFHRDGICRGMCHWFVKLYFKTRGHVSDTEQHLKALGQQFEHGAPRQAAFLQSLDVSEINNLVQFNVQMDNAKISATNKTQDQIIGELQQCLPGVYGIYTSSHQVIYIKINETQQYLFDPSAGVIKVDSPSLFKKGMERYFETHDPKKEICIDLYTP